MNRLSLNQIKALFFKRINTRQFWWSCSRAAVSLERLILAVLCREVGCYIEQGFTFKMLESLPRQELVSVNTLIDVFMH